MNIEQSTTYLFTQVTNLFRAGFEKKLNEIGLHSGQVFVLFELWKTDGISQIELANYLNLSPPTIYKMVKSLEKNGFIKCSACKKDGRVIRVFLTLKGKEHQKKVKEYLTEFEEEFFKGHNETEKLIFFQLLGKLKETVS
jgi:DNA-binding MarR family transcriptional regulator